jgi:hypothetical protein
VSEDFAKNAPDADAQQQDEGEDVEAHGFKPAAEDKSIGATEEGPDVEAHGFKPKSTP